MKKVLIVDDRAEIRKLLSITLGLEYEILLASDGAQALAMVDAGRPAAVFLDVMMPGEMDGFEVLRHIKQNPELMSTRVVMVTAKGQDEDIELAQALGADAYFIKPFSPLKMIQWLEHNLG